MKNILIVSGYTDLAGTENFESASRKARVPARKSTFDEKVLGGAVSCRSNFLFHSQI